MNETATWGTKKHTTNMGTLPRTRHKQCTQTLKVVRVGSLNMWKRGYISKSLFNEVIP
jgi:hypothetical protein